MRNPNGYGSVYRLPKQEKEEKEIFTDLEIQILEKNDHIEWVDTILMLIRTGARINEFLGITKFNVDLDNQIITGGLKTDAGKNSPIPMHYKILKYVQ